MYPASAAVIAGDGIINDIAMNNIRQSLYADSSSIFSRIKSDYVPL